MAQQFKLPNGSSLGTLNRQHVFTWVEGGVGHHSEKYRTAQEACDAAWEHSKARGR
jgi:hypothetical protein